MALNNREEMYMIVILTILGVVGLIAIGLAIEKVLELHGWGYSWGYSFLQALGGF